MSPKGIARARADVEEREADIAARVQRKVASPRHKPPGNETLMKEVFGIEEALQPKPKADEGAAAAGAEMSMMARVGRFKGAQGEEAVASDPKMSMMRRLGQFKGREEAPPVELAMNGIGAKRGVAVPGNNTLMNDILGLEEANRVAMERHSPDRKYMPPQSPREERENLRQQARAAREAEEQAARARVAEAKRKKDVAYGRNHGSKARDEKKKAESRYELQAAKKAAELQAAEEANEARANKREEFRMKQVRGSNRVGPNRIPIGSQ